MVLLSIFSDPVTLLLLVILGVLPAYYFNKYLLKITRPKESIARVVAHIVIVVAVALVYTCIMVYILVNTIYRF
jgi:hypothetical protein